MPGPPPTEEPAAGRPGVTISPSDGDTAGGTSVAPPPPKKGDPCPEGAETTPRAIGESLSGTFTVGYDVSLDTAGIRTSREEIEQMAHELGEISRAINHTSDALMAGGGAAVAVAEAVTSVLSLTADLAQGSAAFADFVLQGHRVYTLEFKVIKVKVEAQWVELLRCVDDEWACFRELRVATFQRLPAVTRGPEEFEGREDMRDSRLNQYLAVYEDDVESGQNAILGYLARHEVGPC